MQENDGWTALMFAANYGHLECVKILAPLENGMKNILGWTALYRTTSSSSNRACAEYLWQFPDERKTNDLRDVERKFSLKAPKSACCAAAYE